MLPAKAPVCRIDGIATLVAGTLLTACVVSVHGADAITLLPQPGFLQSIGVVAFVLPSSPGELEQFVGAGIRFVRTDLCWESIEGRRICYRVARS